MTNEPLKAPFRKLPALQAAVLPVDALDGVDAGAAELLGSLAISRIVDLAASPIFNAARSIRDAAKDARSTLHRLGTVPGSLVDGKVEKLAPEAAARQPIAALQGVGRREADALGSATGADSIAELASWPPFVAARHIVLASEQPPAGRAQLPRKLRLRVSPEGSDEALVQVAVECVAMLERPNALPSDGGSATRLSLGVLASDHVGYLSFDLAPLHDALRVAPGSSVASLLLEMIGARDTVIDLSGAVLHSLGGLDEGAAPRVLPVSLPRAAAGAVGAARGLPAIQAADVDDWRLSPFSFSMSAVPALGEGCCETLLPSSLPTRSVSYVELVREAGAEVPIAGATHQLAHLAHYETVWEPLGHALGEVLYSLTLAPGEAARMAVIDWGRSETASRSETTQTDENLLHGLRRDRLVDEVMDAAIEEYQRGEAFQGGTAGVGGYGSQGSGSMWGVTGSHAVGYASASSSGRRDVAAQNTQRLADAVSQASHAVRALRSTVVVQASQAERATAQTRYVRNYNHSHALTVLYYQIVRHYLLTTQVNRWRRALLLRRTLPAFAQPVAVAPPGAPAPWIESALRHSDVLRRLIADKDLLQTLDQLDDAAMPEIDELRFLDTASLVGLLVEVATGDDDADHDRVRLSLVPARGGPVTWDLAVPEVTRSTTAPHREGWTTKTYRVQCTTAFFIGPSVAALGPEPTPAALRRLTPAQTVGAIVSFNAEETGLSWTLQHIRITATFELDGRTRRIRLVDGPAAPWKPSDDSDLVFDISPPDRKTLADRIIQRDLARERLRRHLYDHRMRYAAAIWMAADPNELMMELRGLPWTEEGAHGTLADYVEPTPLGVIGDLVAYPLGAWQPAEAGQRIERRLASLPTRGAFAEAQLSHCNASEVIDDTRFWDWQISPIPDADQAPEIEQVSTASRARELGLAPTVPPATVGIERPPEAPSPSSLGAILDAVTKSEIFRDMSKADQLASILQELTKAAAGVEQERMKSLVQLDKNEKDLERERLENANARPAAAETSGAERGAARTTTPAAPGSRDNEAGGTAPPAPPPERPTPREVHADIETIERHEADPELRQVRRSRVLDGMAPARPALRNMRFEFLDRWGRPAPGVFAVEVTDDERDGASAGSGSSDASGNHVRVPVSETLRSVTYRVRVQSLRILGTGDLDGLAALFGGGSTVLNGSTTASTSVEGETRVAVLDPADAASYDFFVTFGTQHRVFTVTTEAEARAVLEAELGLRQMLSVRAVGEVSYGGSVQTTLEYVWLSGALDIVQGRRPAGGG